MVNVLRIASPGNHLADWVPSWDDRVSPRSLSVKSLVFQEEKRHDWMVDVQQYVQSHPYTILQYEGKTDAIPILPLETTVICVIDHLTAVPHPGTHVSHFVVPSYYAREALRQKGYRAVTVRPVAETAGKINIVRRHSAPLTVLLHPGTTTKRLLQSIHTVSGNCFKIKWLLIDNGSYRVKTIIRALKKMGQHIRMTTLDDSDIWRQADAMLTDCHPAYALNPFHVRFIAHGILILTTAIGDHPESVKHWHNGFLLSTRRLADDLTYYFKQLMRKPNLIQQLKVNGLSLCEKFHSNTRVLPDWLNVYQQVERGRRR